MFQYGKVIIHCLMPCDHWSAWCKVCMPCVAVKGSAGLCLFWSELPDISIEECHHLSCPLKPEYSRNTQKCHTPPELHRLHTSSMHRLNHLIIIALLTQKFSTLLSRVCLSNVYHRLCRNFICLIPW